MKTISFIELCELIKEGNAPKEEFKIMLKRALERE